MLNSIEKTGLLQMDTENTVDIAFAKIPPSLLFVIFFKENTVFMLVCFKFHGSVLLKQKYF